LYWEPKVGAASYKIYRSLDPMFVPGPGDYVGTTTDTTYTDVNATTLPGGKYFYNVTASSEGGGAVVAPPMRPPSRVSTDLREKR
jgi:fibronectin type 3 domain-containing protein